VGAGRSKARVRPPRLRRATHDERRLLAAAAEGDHVALVASGAWTVERAAELERLIEDARRRHAGARSIDIDLAGLERLDTFGAWLIERLMRSFVSRGSAPPITRPSDTHPP